MIHLKAGLEVDSMRRAGRLSAQARALALSMIEPGVKTIEIDQEVERFIRAGGGIPAFLGYHGFPNSVCISVNEAVIHGIPDGYEIQTGDIVSIDVGVLLDGFYGDCAATKGAGQITAEAQRLIDTTQESFYKGLEFCKVGYRISDISHAIQSHAEGAGFSVVRDFIGHGIGKKLHEAPEVPNFGKAGRGPRLEAGMTLAIEPMVNQGQAEVVILADGWTVLTKDARLSAHYENTVLITDGQAEVLTSL